MVVDGRRVPGSIKIDREVVTIALADFPAEGMHLLQVQNPGGLFSNDFIFYASKKPQSTPDKKPAAKKPAAEKPAAEKPRPDVRTATGARLRELVQAGKLTRAEATELYRIAFPEDDRRGTREE